MEGWCWLTGQGYVLEVGWAKAVRAIAVGVGHFWYQWIVLVLPLLASKIDTRQISGVGIAVSGER